MPRNAVGSTEFAEVRHHAVGVKKRASIAHAVFANHHVGIIESVSDRIQGYIYVRSVLVKERVLDKCPTPFAGHGTGLVYAVGIAVRTGIARRSQVNDDIALRPR